MKRSILDVSDCADSPLLASSRVGRRSRSAHNFERQLLFYSKFSPRNDGYVHELSEKFFGPARPAPAQSETQLEHLETPAPPVEDVDDSRPSYREHCRNRWWNEFRNWFGASND